MTSKAGVIYRPIVDARFRRSVCKTLSLKNSSQHLLDSYLNVSTFATLTRSRRLRDNKPSTQRRGPPRPIRQTKLNGRAGLKALRANGENVSCCLLLAASRKIDQMARDSQLTTAAISAINLGIHKQIVRAFS